MPYWGVLANRRSRRVGLWGIVAPLDPRSGLRMAVGRQDRYNGALTCGAGALLVGPGGFAGGLDNLGLPESLTFCSIGRHTLLMFRRQPVGIFAGCRFNSGLAEASTGAARLQSHSLPFRRCAQPCGEQ